MSVYRITRFASSDMDKVAATAEGLREMLKDIGADFIDIVSYGNGKGVVVAKYPDAAAREAADGLAKMAFGKMIEAGIVDGDAIHPHAGDVVFSL